MKKKGDLIFWEISDVVTTKERLSELGFDRFVPRNDFKSAMIKVLRKLTNGTDDFYRRFNDKPNSVSFKVLGTHEIDDDLQIDNKFRVRVDKGDGSLEFRGVDTEVQRGIQDMFASASKTLDSRQFTSLVLKVVKQECYGFAMRSGGGIYFIDQAFTDTLERLKELFSEFSGARLNIVPVYDDQGTVEALEEAAAMDVSGDIEGLVRDIEKRFRDGTITKRQLEGDKDRAEKIIDKMVTHKKHLRTKYLDVSNRLVDVQKAVNAVLVRVEDGLVDPEDFTKMLADL